MVPLSMTLSDGMS